MDLASQTCRGANPRKRKSNLPENEFRRQANARERDRTNQAKIKMPIPTSSCLNVAYIELRKMIPTDPPDRKLSKVETLRLTMSYVKHLQCTLIAGKYEEQPCVKIMRGSWQDSRIPVCTFCLSTQKKFSSFTRDFSQPLPTTSTQEHQLPYLNSQQLLSSSMLQEPAPVPYPSYPSMVDYSSVCEGNTSMNPQPYIAPSSECTFSSCQANRTQLMNNETNVHFSNGMF